MLKSMAPAQLKAASQMFFVDTDNFRIELEVFMDVDNGVPMVSLIGYHRAELERAANATLQSEKEAKPFLFLNERTLDEVEEVVNAMAPALNVRSYIPEDPGFSSVATDCMEASKRAEPAEEKSNNEIVGTLITTDKQTAAVAANAQKDVAAVG